MTTATHLIKTVPQPVYISSIWHDVEVVVAKFNKNCFIEWRKTYDNYKDTIIRDFVDPLRNGKLVVEGRFE